MNPSDITRLRELAGKSAAGHPGNYMSVNSADIISLCERVEKLEGALREAIDDYHAAFTCSHSKAAADRAVSSWRAILLEGEE